MYIKDSSFYGYVRDDTDASLLFLRPYFAGGSFVTTSATVDENKKLPTQENTYLFRSGYFEIEQPLISAISEEGASLQELSGVLTLEEGEYDAFCYGERNLGAVVVFGTDEDGFLLAPSGGKRIEIYPISPMDINAGGSFSIDLEIPGGSTNVVIESIHICEYLEVDPADVESLSLKEKNDIILSSIPYNDLELSLFDADERYANFIRRIKQKIRSVLCFNYNGIHSQLFLHFFDEEPVVDRNSLPSKTLVKFTGLMGILSKNTFHNTSDGEEDQFAYGFRKMIGETLAQPSYLEMVIDSFNTNGKIWDKMYKGTKSPYGHFIRIKSQNNATDGVVHTTRTSADGYSHADAIRLLINAQCHGMRVNNETIEGDILEALYIESGVVLTDREYLSVPTGTEYGNIDVVKVKTRYSVAGEVKELPAITIDLENDGVRAKSTAGDDVCWKNFVFDESVVGTGFEVSYVTPAGFFGDFTIVHKGSVLTAIWTYGNTGTATIYLNGSTYETVDGVVSLTFGQGTETLELSNPFIRPRASGTPIDAPDHYARFNLEQQANKKIYAIECRGRFDLRPLDRLLYFTEKGELHTGIVIEHALEYNGAMKSTLRILDEDRAPALLCSPSVLCSETTICRGGTEWVYLGSVLLWSGLSDRPMESIGDLSISGWNSILLVISDENGENIRMVEFSNLEYTYSESTFLVASATIGSLRYDLGMEEMWSKAGNHLEAYCTVTFGEDRQLTYINKIYGVS